MVSKYSIPRVKAKPTSGSFAAVPPDVRKGYAFPVVPHLNREATPPQRRSRKIQGPGGTARRSHRRTSGGTAAKNRLKAKLDNIHAKSQGFIVPRLCGFSALRKRETTNF